MVKNLFPPNQPLVDYLLITYHVVFLHIDPLADFPVELYASVGANLDGTPLVCGGYGSSVWSDKCYRFINGVWEEFANLEEQRTNAAGVMYNEKLHLFGGLDGSSRLQTSEIINADDEVESFRKKPDLPAGVYRHAMTAIDDTVSLLSGGQTTATSYSAYSNKTWYYNHDTKAFTSGPDLLEGRHSHGSATSVDKVTNAKIAVVTGGWNGNYMDSTELLINGHWETGTIQKCFDLL